MSAARQAGGIVGMLIVGRLTQLGGLTSLFVRVLGVFGAGVAGLGLASSYGAVLLLLVLTNVVGAVTDVLGQSLMQQAVPAGLRGRASGAWVVAIGVGPVGQLQIGALVAWIGVAAALGVSGARPRGRRDSRRESSSGAAALTGRPPISARGSRPNRGAGRRERAARQRGNHR